MKKTTKYAVLGILLPLIATAAMAQSAISELKLQAGDDAVAASVKLEPVHTSIMLEPQVTPETRARLQSAFRDLKEKGFPGVKWAGLPLGVRYVRVPLQLMTCPGCVSYVAMIPVGALSPTAPVKDPNLAEYFIIERSGEWIKPQARYSGAIKMPVKDVLAQCADLDVLNVRGWTLPEAVAHTQSCLDKTYFQHPFARRIYFVSAQAARFGVRACPENAPRTCNAIMLVAGVKITVSGRVPAGDSVLSDIGYSLEKRHGKLYGFHAILDNKTETGGPVRNPGSCTDPRDLSCHPLPLP
ncbi:MAG: hypothetical protein HY077_12115 [Elusimicrobia bacterium]|nr:hypothetical protein [Elusimicrobiota bacterium]